MGEASHSMDEAEVEAALDRRLAALPQQDVGAWRREHIRREAHALLSGQRAEAPRRRSLWDRALEPTLLAAICLLTLGWAFSQTAALLVGR
jgi:hypothetical protein